MTAFDYTRVGVTAQRMIDRYGQAATIRRETNGGTPFDPTVTTTNHACRAVVTGYKNTEIDGTRIEAGDKKVLVSTAGLEIEPTTADKLLFGGAAHAIVSVEPLAPGGTTLMWTVQARR